ncbi:MAG: hypothetical protein KTR26_16070 [Flammeovirgaceae bacterium]|nr:hypothetical protein [Flammeovirgaceae bacterium]
MKNRKSKRRRDKEKNEEKALNMVMKDEEIKSETKASITDFSNDFDKLLGCG